MNVVNKLSGCPTKIRVDRGTENGHIEVMQRVMRNNHDDSLAGDKSFVYGTSPANQRIESWWGILRKQCSQHWMNLCSSLKEEDTFSGSMLDKNLVRFCFMKLIQV